MVCRHPAIIAARAWQTNSLNFRTHLGLPLKEVVSQNTKTIKKGICDEAVKYEQSIRGKALGRRTK
jgi:hypothetical protein